MLSNYNMTLEERIKDRIDALEKEEQMWKSAVLGYTSIPGNYSWDDFLWRYSRHPNYFCEWMCWNCIFLSTLPSLHLEHIFASGLNGIENDYSLPVKILVLSMLLMGSRFFYDCLVYWTGAGPAEYFSALKRPDYCK